MTVTIAYLQIEVLKDELETAKEAAERAPSKTLKHLVERLRNQLALKEKQQKVMSCGYTLNAIPLSILTENDGPLWLVIVWKCLAYLKYDVLATVCHRREQCQHRPLEKVIICQQNL